MDNHSTISAVLLRVSLPVTRRMRKVHVRFRYGIKLDNENSRGMPDQDHNKNIFSLKK